MENERTEKLSMNNLVCFSLSKMNDDCHKDDPSDSHHIKEVMKDILEHRAAPSAEEAFVTSNVILEGFREGGSMEVLKARQRRNGPAYSYISLFTGGMLGMMSALRVGFKNVMSTEIIKPFKRAIKDLTGIGCHGDTFAVDYSSIHSPCYMQVTTECPDYARGSTVVREGMLHGVDGESGWQLILVMEPISQLMPLIVEIEMVANALAIHDGKEVAFVMEKLHGLKYHVHAAIVKMQSYGDIIGKERLVVVGCHECLGEHGRNHRIPIGDYSDVVSFCARDVIEKSLDESNARYFDDKEIAPLSQMAGDLQVVARKGYGQGFSASPHASCNLDGQMPTMTTHGNGRHQPPDWKEGDPVGKSYMFTMEDALRAQNLPDDYISYMKRSIEKNMAMKIKWFKRQSLWDMVKDSDLLWSNRR